MKNENQNKILNTYHKGIDFIKAVFTDRQVMSERKFLELYNEYIVQGDDELYSLTSIDPLTVRYGEFDNTIQYIKTKDSYLGDNYGTVNGSVEFCSPLFVTQDNEHGKREILFKAELYVSKKNQLAYKAKEGGGNVKYDVMVHLDPEQFKNSFLSKKLGYDNYFGNKGTFLRESLQRDIENTIGNTSMLQSSVNAVVLERLENISFKELQKETDIATKKREWFILEEFGVLPSYRIYNKKANGYDGGEGRNAAIKIEEKYGKEITHAETESLKEVFGGKYKDLLKGRTVAYRGGAGSKKLDFLVDKGLVKRLYYIDKSDQLLIEQNQGKDSILYGDYTDQNSILGHGVDSGAFIGGELGNQHQYFDGAKTYEDLIRNGVYRYIKQAKTSKPDGGLEILSFFTNETTEKEFLSLYDTPIFEELLFQTIADEVNWRMLGFKILDGIPQYGTSQWDELAEKLHEIIEYKPEFGKKTELGNLSRLGFVVKEGKSLPLINRFGQDFITKKSGEYICINPTTRFDKEWIKKIIEEEWGKILVEEKIKHNHGMVIIGAEHSGVEIIKEEDTLGIVESKGFETKGSILKNLQRFRKTILVARLALTGLLGWGFYEGNELVNENNIAKASMINSYLEREGMEQDTISYKEATQLGFMGNINKLSTEVTRFLRLDECSEVQKDQVISLLYKYIACNKEEINSFKVGTTHRLPKIISNFLQINKQELDIIGVSMLSEKISIKGNEALLYSEKKDIYCHFLHDIGYVLNGEDLYLIEKYVDDISKEIFYVPSRMYYDKDGVLRRNNSNFSPIQIMISKELKEYTYLLKKIL